MYRLTSCDVLWFLSVNVGVLELVGCVVLDVVCRGGGLEVCCRCRGFCCVSVD